MHSVIMRILFVVVVALVSAPPSIAQSEKGKTGRLDAYACEELPAPLRIDVQMLDDTPRYLRIREKFILQMRQNGTEVVAGAPLVLTIDVTTMREFSQSDKNHIGEVRVDTGGSISLRGKIWSNTEGSVLGGRKKSSDRLAVDQLKVTANLNWRDDGRCVWQGEFLHDLQGGDPDRAAVQFAPSLVDAIGRSIRDRTVTVFD